MDAINVDHLNFYYGDLNVIQNASFSIKPGEFIGIIGPNGGGKTTLLRLLMGFLKPSSGSIKIFDKKPEEALEMIAYVPQNLRYDRQFPISVFELVLSGLLDQLPWYGWYSAEQKKAAKEAIDRMGIPQCANKPIGDLSGGQLQRALIARALVSKPKLLLLDEPTANVDIQAETDIYALLKSIAGDVTILMVTHNLRACIEQVHRVLCIEHKIIPLKASEVCEHFALGLYHSPLLVESESPDPCCQLQVKKGKV